MSLCVTFLGTGGAVPSVQRNTSGVLIRREGERLLFDCGEGTQRQMMRFGTGFDISHIFVSHMHGDHVLGLPGLLQTMEFNDRSAPVTIHVPNGCRPAMRDLLNGTRTRPSFPLRVREVGGDTVAYRASEFEIRVFNTEHRTKSVGYALTEDDRKGRFDRERAEELGVPAGPLFSKLHEGESVELEDGTVVDSAQVVGPARSGRRVVYTGDTRPVDATVGAADDADLLIHDATFTDTETGRAASTGHSTAREAATIGARAGAARLALTHISSRYAGHIAPIQSEASEVFDGEAFVPDDGDEIEVPFPEV
jgi:ribonuclease Z